MKDADATNDKRNVIKVIKRELNENSVPAVDVLAKKFQGASVLVVSAGPSAKYWREVYESLPKPVLVVCIKQSIELEGLGELCDMHFCNTWNLKRYAYDRSRVLRFFSSARNDPPSFQSWDVQFTIDRGVGGLETSLAAKMDFENWTLANSGLKRPWGPGVMYETVIYSLIHMGAKSIHTVGWDVAGVDGSNLHFYEKSQSRDSSPKRTQKVSRVRSFTSRLGGQKINQYIKFLQGKKYNFCGMLAGEAELVSRSLPMLYKWLVSRDVEFLCFTESKWFPESMARPMPYASESK